MFFIGLVMVIVGVPFTIKGFRTLALLESHPFYTLANGVTEEELAMSSFIWLVVALAGVALVIFAIIKRRNKSALDDIQNSTQKSYCEHCKLNVSSSDGTCPICGEKL